MPRAKLVKEESSRVLGFQGKTKQNKTTTTTTTNVNFCVVCTPLRRWVRKESYHNCTRCVEQLCTYILQWAGKAEIVSQVKLTKTKQNKTNKIKNKSPSSSSS